MAETYWSAETLTAGDSTTSVISASPRPNTLAEDAFAVVGLLSWFG